MKPWLTVVGISCDDSMACTQSARDALSQAELIIGSPRQLAIVKQQNPEISAPLQAYPSPFSRLAEILETQQQQLVLLASGDPLFYGVGDFLLRRLSASEILFIPAVSCMQVAFSRIGRVWTDAQIVSLHGRPMSDLNASLRSDRLLGIMTDSINTPQQIAGELSSCGFMDANVWVLEDLGTACEKVSAFSVSELMSEKNSFSSLNVVIVETGKTADVLPEFPGIDDIRFATGTTDGSGLLTKKEIRVNILAMLASKPGDIAWDIGAGCGGVCIEWSLWNRSGHIYAVEKNSQRSTLLGQNREKFGVQSNLHLIEGAAPEILVSLPDPDAVFVGGSGGDLASILTAVWERLNVQGRLVVSTVTEESRCILYNFMRNISAVEECIELTVRRSEELADRRILRPALPVLLIRLEKNA